ncbi:hypothetical protein BDV11DRAFT_63559 [Aspergillus similis]
MHWLGLPHSARAWVVASFFVCLLGRPYLVPLFPYFAAFLGFVALVYIWRLISSSALDLTHR